VYAVIRGLWRQMTVGLWTTAIFGDLCGYFLGNKASSIIRRYATPCRPV